MLGLWIKGYRRAAELAKLWRCSASSLALIIRLTPQEVSGTVDLQRTWRADPWLKDEETLEPSGPDDYVGVGALGYQRGHQAPLASFKGVHAARELNYLSNITPQRGALNGGPWKDLEDAVREYVRRLINGLLKQPMMQRGSSVRTETI